MASSEDEPKGTPTVCSFIGSRVMGRRWNQQGWAVMLQSAPVRENQLHGQLKRASRRLYIALYWMGSCHYYLLRVHCVY